MKTVEFKFDLDQKVTILTGMTGIVSMLGLDRGGNQYFVKGANNSDWYMEDQLTVVE